MYICGSEQTISNGTIIMTNHHQFPRQLWIYLGKMQKKNKLNVCISSTLIIVSLVSYQSHYRTYDMKTGDISTMHTWSTTPYIQEPKYETTRSYLCYTNDPEIFPTWKRRANIFSAKLSEKEAIFLSIDGNIKKILNIDHLCAKRNCFSRNSTFLYHCCAYSPYLESRVNHMRFQETDFSFERRVVTDNFIRIEDILVGKPEIVDLSAKIKVIIENYRELEITVQHRCRGDILVDPYPEVHISVDTTPVLGNTSHKAYHWYL